MVYRVAGAILLAFALAAGCTGGAVEAADPEVATLVLLFPGDDSVIVDVASGNVTSGPITIFSTVDFSAQFFADDGTPDERVTDARFRLDVTPADTGIVTFSRGGAFSGTLNKVGGGNTEIVFALVLIADASNLFARSVPASVN